MAFIPGTERSGPLTIRTTTVIDGPIPIVASIDTLDREAFRARGIELPDPR